MNLINKGSQPTVSLSETFAFGEGNTIAVRVLVLIQPFSERVTVMVCIPAFKKLTLLGFCTLEKIGFGEFANVQLKTALVP